MPKKEDGAVDVSLDLLGIKPVAAAAEHASKAVVDGVGKFLSAICMPAAEEIGLALRDRVARFRQKNLADIVHKTQERLEQQSAVPTGECSPPLVRQIIEEASWVDDACIQDMWAGLLATACTTEVDDSILYTDVLKRLSPFQARVLNLLYSDPRTYDVAGFAQLRDEEFSPRYPVIYPVEEILGLFPGDLSRFVPIEGVTHASILADAGLHYLAIGRFRPQLDGLVALGLARFAQIAPAVRNERTVTVTFQPSVKGLDLYMRGQGITLYPLEAFLVARNHQYHSMGMTPFARDGDGRKR